MTPEQQDTATYCIKLTKFYENRWQTDLIDTKFIPDRDGLTTRIEALKYIRGVLEALLKGKVNVETTEEAVLLRGMQGRLNVLLDAHRNSTA